MQPTVGESGFVLDGRDWQFLPVTGKLCQGLQSIEGTCCGGGLNIYTLFADCQVVAFGGDWIVRLVRYFYRYKRILVDKLHGDGKVRQIGQQVIHVGFRQIGREGYCRWQFDCF